MSAKENRKSSSILGEILFVITNFGPLESNLASIAVGSILVKLVKRSSAGVVEVVLGVLLVMSDF